MENIRDKNLYYIGGVVRDELLGKKSYDIDLTYDGDAIKFAKNIPNAQIVRINEDFGTVRININGQNVDIASTRSESYPQKGHLPVIEKIGCSLKEDVLRRDFSVNALAKSTLTGEIIDYTGGLKDIKDKKLRILHDNSFIDDPTRIVRGLKFSIRFGFELEEKTRFLQDSYLSCIDYDMSYKRLQKELKETFNLNSFEGFKIFINNNIYKLISPQEFICPDYDFSALIEEYKPDNIWIIYIGLLPDISVIPLTKKERCIIDKYNELKNLGIKDKFELYKSFINAPLESIIMYSTVDSSLVEQFLKIKDGLRLKINGNDLLKMGVAPSDEYNMCFRYILDEKLKNPELDKSQEILLAKKFFNIL